MRLAIASILASLVVAGCTHADTGDDAVDDDSTDTGTTTDDDDGDQPHDLITDGTYKVTTELGITIEHLLPETGANLVARLRSFTNNPGHALLDLADDANVPAVDILFAALPGSLEDKIEDWMSDEIAKVKIGGAPLTTFTGQVVSLAETVLTTVDLHSTLTLDGTSATHHLDLIDFAPAGINVHFGLGLLPDDLIDTTATATIISTPTEASLELGDHRYALYLGQYAWDAIEAKMLEDHGGTLREVLGNAMNCPAIAAKVADKCVLGACVGHETQVNEICEKGLDKLVDYVRDEITSYRMDALRFKTGTGLMTDADSDGVADTLAGTWSAELNAGQGLRPSPSTFSGTR